MKAHRHRDIQKQRGHQDDPCNGEMELIDAEGDVWTFVCARCGAEFGIPAAQCDPRIAAMRRRVSSKIPDRFLGRRFDTDEHNKDALFGVKNWFDDKGDCMLPAPAICGAPGRGKSHLLAAICSRLINQRGMDVAFWDIRAWLRELQRFDDVGVCGLAWERAVNIEILALDDFGAERGSDWRHEQLAELIDRRYAAEKPILIASNWARSDWDQIVDARTCSRLRGMTFEVVLTGPDRR